MKMKNRIVAFLLFLWILFCCSVAAECLPRLGDSFTQASLSLAVMGALLLSTFMSFDLMVDLLER